MIAENLLAAVEPGLAVAEVWLLLGRRIRRSECFPLWRVGIRCTATASSDGPGVNPSGCIPEAAEWRNRRLGRLRFLWQVGLT